MPKLFKPDAQYPPAADIERIAKYRRARAIYDGRLYDVYERASELLKDTPAAPQLAKLYIAVNLMDTIISKPADLMVGEPPTFESGKESDGSEQAALNRIVEENDVVQLVHEAVTGGGIRGDAWFKTYYSVRQDFSALTESGLPVPDVDPEPIIEAVDGCYVFPELAKGSRKKFTAVNVAYVEWVSESTSVMETVLSGQKTDETPYLNVERHLPGYIVYERYKLTARGVNAEYGVNIPVFTIGDAVPTGRETDIVETGVNRPLIFHAPYKSVDDTWQGVGGIEKLESVLAAINDRIVQIDYILWKHSDPIAYGPDDIGDDGNGDVRWGGKYIPVEKGDQVPGYMTWDSQLDGAFKELDLLLSLVFTQSETPQWLFGTIVAGADKGGTGTSHTDGVAIKARFMPILSKVKRIRSHIDRALRDALWTAMELENYANEGVEGFNPYEPVYPKINWRDGIPRNEKEEAEVYAIRTGAKPTADVRTAIKRMDALDDAQADEIMTRIDEDEEKAAGTVDGTVFNEVVV
ncbi:phage portal protein [Paenibacillus sp. J5C_2022]|uniref:phage portal protein n=1 Tax=Paenibacillus sp. J5C2022 TaxID=2977129 RepID=UPI0021D31365|nr:phage portal protein [Paenibacillus sp. J5C2022]MCU6709343.1 phage portal protein [Paenibacillus sp. J5C2022]